MARADPPATPQAPTLFRAERLSGPDGAVEWWGNPLTEAEAIARLNGGQDVVARGPSRRDNRNAAMRLVDHAFGGARGGPAP